MRIAFAAGGTGGHLYPALCTAAELRGRERAFDAVFFISQRGDERMICEDYGFPCVELPVKGMGGLISLKSVAALLALPRAVRTAAGVMRERRIQAVIGFGAYVSAAPVLAARCLGLKIILHEQNAVMGRANRFLRRFADLIAFGLPPARRRGGRRAVYTGIPLRRELRAGVKREDALSLLGLQRDRFTVLVMGGSQGARSINLLMTECARFISAAGDVQIIHLSGKKDYSEIVMAYRRAGLASIVLPYLKEMGRAYAAADIAVCRAGAMTLAEIACAGIPSILIPYPHSAGRHQEANAAVFERAGAAVVRGEDNLAAGDLAGLILSLKGDRAKLAGMSDSARSLAVPDAAERLSDLIREAVEE